MNNSTKTCKKFTCCRCLEIREVMSDRDTHPLYLCSACIWHDKTKNQIIVTLDGAPAGKVTGTSNPCKLRNVNKTFKK